MATPAPQPVYQQPVQQQPVQSFGQPMQQMGYPGAGYPPAGYPGQPMQQMPMMGAPMMMPQQPMMMPQQPQVVYVQQPAVVAQPQVVYVQAPAASKGYEPLAGQSTGSQNVFISVAGHKNLRIEEGGKVNANGGEGALAQLTLKKHANGTFQMTRGDGKFSFRIRNEGVDGNGAPTGSHTFFKIVPHGAGYTFNSHTNGYMAFDGSGNPSEVNNISQAAVLTFKPR
jgi:hypothetical protein